MIIGELFIKLGILGDDKAKKGLTGVKGGLKEAKEMSLEAKAAIVGMVYGLERLMSNSMNAGANLMTFANVTGMSVERLQEWQYAARHANVSAEEMESNFVNLQSAMTKIRLGGAAPAGLGVIADALEKAGIGFDMKRAGEDIEYLMKSLQSASQLPELKGALGNEMLKGFVGHNTIGAMRQNVFTEENFAKAPKYSGGEAARLQNIKNAWGDLEQMFEMGIGKANTRHGLQIVNDLKQASAAVIRMVNAFEKLAAQTHLFEKLGQVFEGWGYIFDLIGEGVDKLNEFSKPSEMTEEQKNVSAKQYQTWMKMNPGASAHEKEAMAQNLMGVMIPPRPRDTGHHVASHNTQNINVVNHNHNVKDAKDVGHHTRRAIQQAGRQSKAAGRPQ